MKIELGAQKKYVLTVTFVDLTWNTAHKEIFSETQ